MTWDDKQYSLAENPPCPITWDEYSQRALSEFNDLLNTQSNYEPAFQAFFERNPGLMPGAFSLSGESGHDPYNTALISQPKLGEIGWTRIPDFVWLAWDSTHFTPVFIEIEAPSKKMFKSNNEATADFTQALGQISDWKALLRKPEIILAFYNFFQIPQYLREKTFRSEYLLLFGRRKEYEGDEQRTRLRSEFAGDVNLMSYDRIFSATSSKYFEFLCSKIEDRKYHVISIPPTYCYCPLTADVLTHVVGFESKITEMQMVSEDRKNFLRSRYSYWLEYAMRGCPGVKNSMDRE